MTIGLPPRQGLYDPANEHDACGLNFVCDMKGRASHRIVQHALGALCALEHRGAAGADPDVGDGAGILTQLPDAFLREVVGFDLPDAGRYATGIAFLPQDPQIAAAAKAEIQRIAVEEGLVVLGWRDVPVDPDVIGAGARVTMPSFSQPFFTHSTGTLSGIDLDRVIYIARKRFEHEIHLEAGADEVNEAMGGASSMHDGVYFPSLSTRTIVYKGMLTTPQLGAFYPDLRDPRFASAIALVHSRFSTNTFPSWPLAHPYRLVAHNGEINTIKGNRNWMQARQSALSSELFGDRLESAFPICTPGASDTAGFDECLELLTLSGYSVPEAILMMIPEPWENHASMSEDRRAFYEYFSTLMEPWDGPASVSFTDGTVVGAVLDRNGLRPSRYWVTSDDLVIMASEVGVVDIDPSTIIEKGRLEPGRIFFIDTEQGRILRDDEIKAAVSAKRPYADLVSAGVTKLGDLPVQSNDRGSEGTLETQQIAFGYTHEDLKMLVAPMVATGKEALGSMGTDTPIAALSQRARLLPDYFQQLFAQVTNPPLDAIREELVTAVGTTIGPRGNLLAPGSSAIRQIHIDHPVLSPDEFARLLPTEDPASGLTSVILDIVFPSTSGAVGLATALDGLRKAADRAITNGAGILILSDRVVSPSLAPIPALLATATVHHHLVANGTRGRADIVVETGEAREVHHVATLLGFGARAVHPYVAFDTIIEMARSGQHGLDLSAADAQENYIKAFDKGLLKVMSKMGISTVASYTGAQIFEAIGLSSELLEEYFGGMVSRLGGVGLDILVQEVLDRHDRAFPANSTHRAHRSLEAGGEYQWRREGEFHLFNPDTVFKLQHATRDRRFDIFREYTGSVNDHARNLSTLRGLFAFKDGVRRAIALDEVESVSDIVKRFSTGAMSYGSISAEAHETLAIAMNRLGAKSNTGEGGEDDERFDPMANGDSKRSAIKQVASGRFGVTSNYLVNADDLQIKMAQGAKPGEGGQLPGHKVYPWIAKTRNSTPGVGLISPPPHHDIYSIEDLAQLIYDLKSANPVARVHVKLVSELGVGTVAAGVSKAHADVVLISGHDGGTGASPLTSVKHAGAPWELGLAETQQTLLMNGLRDRIVVQVDGQLKTGRDVMIAALLGADEFGFATAPLVVMGCVMMRVCHLNTCPVGVATQDPELRKKFSGTPEFVVNFFEFIAEEVRELLAELGFRSLEEAIGQAESLDTTAAVDHWKADGLDLSPILYVPPLLDGEVRRNTGGQNHKLDEALDARLLPEVAPAINGGAPVRISTEIRNVNRSVGTQLGYHLTKRHGAAGLPNDSIIIEATGSAGNSFGAFVPKGITLRLVGDANDFVGKGLSGGRITVRPPGEMACVAEENVIAGNVIGYGATAGELYLRGLVGERFCVRNSGATAVVEGVGDHGCEYMTGGVAVILGPTGRNFAAGMSGGEAFVYDEEGVFESLVNTEMVDLDPLDDDDETRVAALIDTHVAETGSDVGIRILADWDSARSSFVKVMPRDFKRVLVAAAEARAAGTDEMEAIMASAKRRGARHG
ncbi:MAG: glutamate synthase (NADPH/NADH) large chain [Verrucomicrobiales bacterium]|jgi:glutamate synthase (NADPH/NADH) large chain